MTTTSAVRTGTSGRSRFLVAVVLFVFFVISLLYNVYGHLGFELYPAGWNRHWLGRWMNTSVAHNQHHHHFKGNYGLYFMFWDRWMGTVRQDYDASFSELSSRERVVQEAAGALVRDVA